MKVVFIADCLTTQIAGIHYYAKNFIPDVIRDFSNNEFYHITSEAYEIVGSKNIVIPINQRVPFHYRLRYFGAIPKVINSLDADVAIEMAHFGPFRLNRQIKRMTMVHDLTPILYPYYHDRLSVTWHRLFFRRLLQKVDGILTNSYSTKKDVVDQFGIEPNKIYVNYPRLASTFTPKTDEDKTTTTFLTVGTIEPRKRHELILAGFERAYGRGFSDFEWIVVGQKGWNNYGFYNKLNKSPVNHLVDLVGYVDDEQLHDLYKKSDVLVYASEYEGFGMPITESLSYGLKLILSDTIVHREVAGEAGLYFSDINVLAELIIHNDQIELDIIRERFEQFSRRVISLPFLS